jgi:hypothetical protein
VTTGDAGTPLDGATGTGGGAGSSGSGGSAGSGGTENDACPPIPAVPQYDCKPRPPATTDCAPWNSDANSPVGYPQGCSVKTTGPDGFSGGCGPQVCSCSMFPSSGGTFSPAWVCPL